MDGQNNGGRSFEPKWTVMVHDSWVNVDGHSTSGPQDGTVLVSASRKDVRELGLQGLGIGRVRGSPRTTVLNIFIC